MGTLEWARAEAFQPLVDWRTCFERRDRTLRNTSQRHLKDRPTSTKHELVLEFFEAQSAHSRECHETLSGCLSAAVVHPGQLLRCLSTTAQIRLAMLQGALDPETKDRPRNLLGSEHGMPATRSSGTASTWVVGS